MKDSHIRIQSFASDAGRIIFAVVLACVCAITIWVSSYPAEAAIPKLINFQGKLTAVSNGTNVANGTYAFRFKIYDDPSVGSLLWTETFDQPSGVCSKLTVTNGVFNAKLGSCGSPDALSALDFNGGSLYLTVDFAPTGVAYDGEMSPRKQLTAAAYAFNANSVTGDGRIDIAYAPGTTTNPGGRVAYSPSVSSSNNALAVSANSNVTGVALLITQAGSGAGIELAGAGGASRTINSTSTALTLQTTTSGNVILNAGGSSTIELQDNSNVTGILTISSILQVGSATATTYSRLGTGTTGHTLDAANDLLISDDLEVDDDAFFDDTITVAGTATFTLADTENIVVTNTVTGTNAVDLIAVTLTNQASSGTQRGLVVTNANDGGDRTTEALVVLDNAETTANLLTDYILITKANTGPDTSTDAIDVSDPDLGVALRVDANPIIGTTGLIDYTNFDVDASGNIDTAGTIQAGSSNVTLTLSTGFIDADALTLTTSGTAGATFSSSGLEVVADGLTLLKGCSDGQILKWDDATDVRWECQADNSGGGGSLQGAYDGGTPTILTDASGSIIFQTIGGGTNTQFQVAAVSAPEIDIMNIANTGQGTVTTGVDGLSIDFVTGNGSTPTNSGLNIALTSGGGSGDILHGINLSLSGTGGTENGINIGSGFDQAITVNSGALALNSNAITSTGALNITGAGVSTWDIGANTLSLQTTGNGAITTGTGLLTQGGNVTFSGTTARVITGPTTGGLSVTVASGPLTLSTTTSGALAVTSAGTLNLTAAAASTFAFPASTANTLQITNGSTAFLALDSRTTTSGVTSIALAPIAPTIASASGTQFIGASFTPGTYNFTGTTNQTGTGTASSIGMLFGQATLAGNGTHTITESSNLLLNGAVRTSSSSGTQTITNSFGLNILAGSALNGSGGSVINSYGLSVNAPTGATNNYAASFLGGNVGIGTAAPAQKLAIQNGVLLQTPGASGSLGTVTELSNTTLGGLGSDIVVSGKYAYIVESENAGTCSGTTLTGCELRIYEVSKPSAPTAVGGLSIGVNTNGMAVSGRYAYIGTNVIGGSTCPAQCELQVINISNPSTPVALSGVDITVRVNVTYLSGKYLYIGTQVVAGTGCSATDSSGCEFRIYDISNPASPTFVNGLDLAIDLSEIVVQGRYAYLGLESAAGNDFRIIDISNPASLTTTGGIDITDSVTSLQVSGKYAYVGNDALAGGTCSGATFTGCEFRIINIANPASPSVVSGSGIDTGNTGTVTAMSVAGNYVYFAQLLGGGTNCSALECELNVYDISAPATPVLVAALDTGTNSFGLAVSGKYLYLPGDNFGGTLTFKIYDLSGIDAPAASIGTIASNYINVSENARIDNNLYVGNSINVGIGGLQSSGGISIEGATTALNMIQGAATAGSPTGLLFTGGAHTALAASTEAIDVNLNLARTVQFATGALALQRASVVQAPTYGFVGASTLTDAATFAITGAPKSQTNATITNSHGLLIQAGAVQPAGAVTNAYGLTVNAPTGAVSNFAAVFLGGNVGIGTASPGAAKLHILVPTGVPPLVLDREVDSMGVYTFGENVTGGTRQFSLYRSSSNLFYQNTQGSTNFTNTGAQDFAFQSNSQGTPVNILTLKQAGNVGIGTTLPDRPLEVNSATGLGLRLTYNDADGSATNYSDLSVTSGGNLTVVPAGGTVNITGITTISSILQVGSATATTYSRLGTGATGHTLDAANDLLISDDLEVDGDAFFDGNLTVTGTCTGCGGGASSLQGAYDGATPTILTDASGDIIFRTIGGATDTQFEINAASAPEIDMVLISNSGQGTVTTGVDGLQIDFVTGDGTNPTNSGVNITLTSGGTTSGDITRGLFLDLASVANAASTNKAIEIENTAAWDIDIELQNDETIDNVADGIIAIGATTVDISGALLAGSSNIALTLSTGFIDADALTLTTSGTAGATFSSSGLEVVSDGLTLLKGCSDGQILKWDDATDVRWECQNDNSGGGGSLQGAYDGGGAGDQLVTLDGTQDSIIFSNPASSGTDSTFTLKIEQLNTGIANDALYIDNRGTGLSFRIDDIVSDATPVIVDADGRLGIGTTTITGSTERLLQVGSPTNRGNTVSYGDVVSKGYSDITALTGIKDIFIYDTTADSDGGRWIDWATTDKLSWYTETLDDGPSDPCVIATDDRCYQSSFPRRAILVVTLDALYIFDGATNNMWMKFDQNAAGYALGIATNNDISSVAALNGVIYVTTNGSANSGLYVLDFVNDRMWNIDGTDRSGADKGISQRNTAIAYNVDNNTAFDLSTVGTAAQWEDLNDVSVATSIGSTTPITIGGTANTNPASGSTFVGLATDAGITLISLAAGNVKQLSDNADDDYTAVHLTRRGRLYALNTSQDQLEKWHDYDAYANSNKATLVAGAPTVFWDQAAHPALWPTQPNIIAGAPDALEVIERGSLSSENEDIIYVGMDLGLAEIHDNIVGLASQRDVSGWVKYYSTTRQSAMQVGGVKTTLMLDETAGTIAEDASFNDVDLSYINTPTLGVNGSRGKAVSFDNATEYICSDTDENAACDVDTAFNMTTTGFTLSMWFKHSTSVGAIDVLFEKCVTAVPAQAIGCVAATMTATGTMLIGFDDDATWTRGSSYDVMATSTTLYNDNQWHHLILSRANGVDMDVYIDGNPLNLSSATNPTASQDGSQIVTFGAGCGVAAGANCAAANTANHWDGAIDDIMFANSTTVISQMSAAQARRLHNDARPPASKKVITVTDATSASTTTLTDTGEAWLVNEFAGTIVEVTGGTGGAAACVGQTRRVTSNTLTQLTFSPALTGCTPDTSTDFEIDPEAIYGAATGVYAIGITAESSLGEARQMCVGTNSTTDTGGVTCFNHQAGPNIVADIFHGASAQFDDAAVEWTGGDYDDIRSIDLYGRALAIGSEAHFYIETRDVQLGQGLDYLANQLFNIRAEIINDGIALTGSLGVEVGFTGGADLAEYYYSTELLEAGDVVVIDTHGDGDDVLRANRPYSGGLLGVVSTQPGLILGQRAEDGFPVALTGRVPVKFSMENGPVRAGDYLTSASISGFAMRATGAGPTIGKALADSPAIDSMADCPLIDFDLPVAATKCGSIIIFVEHGNFSGLPIEQLMHEMQISVSTDGVLIEGSNEGLVETDETTVLEATGLESDAQSLLTTDEKILVFLKHIKESKQAAGQGVSAELFTDRVSAAFEVVSPQVTTAGLKVEVIGKLGGTIDLLSDTVFFGRPYLNSDTAGFALIKQGQKSIDITFEREYLEQPVVTVGITGELDMAVMKEGDPEKVKRVLDDQDQYAAQLFEQGIQSLVIKKSSTGFTIIINKPAPRDIYFSWIALAVKNPKLFGGDEPTPAVEEESSDSTTLPPEVAGASDNPVQPNSTGSDSSDPVEQIPEIQPSVPEPPAPEQTVPPEPDPAAPPANSPELDPVALPAP